MSVVSRLIEVKYKDLTNYNDNPGTDVVGCPIDFHWGPVKTMLVLNRTQFFQQYPETLPIGAKYIDPNRYFAYAQLKKAFENGASYVEVYRPQGNWQYQEIYFSKYTAGMPTYIQNPSAPGYVASEAATVVYNTKQFAGLSGKAFALSFKYPGFFPKSLADGYDAVAVDVTITAENNVSVRVLGCYLAESATAETIQINNVDYLPDYDSPLEEWEGVTDPAATEDGQSIFLENVFAQSEFLSCKVGEQVTNLRTCTNMVIGFIPLNTDEVEYPEAPTTLEWEAALEVYNETMTSAATLLISPVSSGELNARVIRITKERQDLMGVIGLPVSTVFSKAEIESYLQSINGIRDMFSVFVACRELISVFGYNIASNGTAGWCGQTITVATSVNTNQLASAFTYGAYYGTLTSSLTFDDVCDLHELGVISVFSSNQGALIWGVRSLHKKQTSYFGKANVIRVLAEILRQVFPICLDAIHTDAAANPLSRSNFNTRFNSVIDSEIAAQNLKSDSYADCEGEINSDINTKGGEIFNVVLSLHFMKLTERIKIQVYATDSSVQALIS